MQEKVSIMGVWCGQKNLSLGITVRHHSASLVMPISDPRDRFFYPHHTPIKDTYYLTQDRIKITCILCIGCIGSHVSTSSSDVVFCAAVTSKNDVSLCKLDVNVMNQTATAGSVDFFKFQ